MPACCRLRTVPVARIGARSKVHWRSRLALGAERVPAAQRVASYPDGPRKRALGVATSCTLLLSSVELRETSTTLLIDEHGESIGANSDATTNARSVGSKADNTAATSDSSSSCVESRDREIRVTRKRMMRRQAVLP